MRASKLSLSLCSVCFFASGLGFGQADRTALTGTVYDSAGRRLAGAHVVAREDGTGLSREATASATGTYDIPELPVGQYRLTFSAAGFADTVYDGVPQALGHTRTLDARLPVAGAAVHIDVPETAPLLDATSAALGANIERKQVEELPLNGRNWSNLTALVPGAVDTGGSNQRSIRFAGRGLDDNNFTYDGIDATNIVNQAQQPFVRLAIPTDAIAEFRVDIMLFTAEQGSTPGGQIAVASKAGSNQLHGRVFEFLRNDLFDAREPIDALNPTKPAFRLNQFGAGMGGPLSRDGTFFYATYEGLRQTLGQTLPGFVPTDAYRAQVAAAAPALLPVLTAYPAATLPIAGSTQVAQYVSSGRQIDDEDSGMLRIDRRFSSADTMYGRFNFDAAASLMPLAQGGSYLGDRQQVESRPANGELEWLHIFSSALVDEGKFGFNRGNVYTTNLSTLGSPYAVAVPGFTTLANNQYKVGVGNTFAALDNLTLVKGAHTLKAGLEVRRIQLNQGNTASGTVSFSSLSSFVGDAVSSASYAAPLPVNGLRKTAVYAYLQDEWKARPNLSVNAGLRYSFYDRFSEVLGRAIPFDFGTCGAAGFCGAGASFGQRNLLDFDPRLSLAWSPLAGGGKTVLRAGAGIYHGDGQLDDQNLPINNEVARFALSAKTLPTLSFPVTPFLATATGIVSPRNMDRTRKDMYVTQWSLSAQRALPRDLVGTLSYVGSKGTDLLTTSYLNLIDPATGVRPNPAFGQVEYRGNRGNSSYQGLVAMLQRSFTRGLLVSANYTYAHEIDQDAAGGGDADFPQDPACPRCERASGDFDVRHVFHVSAVYDLPFGRGGVLFASSGLWRNALGGWSLTAIESSRGGLPINVTIDRSSSAVATGYTTSQRPNRVPGVSLLPPGGRTTSSWINPAAFTTVIGSGYGNTPRNVARGPSLWQADLGVAKVIPLTERVQMQFRSEFFNVFNRAQYGLPLADVSSANFGRIISTVNTGPVGTGTPRQVQFLLQVAF